MGRSSFEILASDQTKAFLHALDTADRAFTARCGIFPQTATVGDTQTSGTRLYFDEADELIGLYVSLGLDQVIKTPEVTFTTAWRALTKNAQTARLSVVHPSQGEFNSKAVWTTPSSSAFIAWYRPPPVVSWKPIDRELSQLQIGRISPYLHVAVEPKIGKLIAILGSNLHSLRPPVEET